MPVAEGLGALFWDKIDGCRDLIAIKLLIKSEALLSHRPNAEHLHAPPRLGRIDIQRSQIIAAAR